LGVENCAIGGGHLSPQNWIVSVRVFGADLPGWEAVETWVAEIGSPRQPAPIQPVVAPQPSTPAPTRGTDDVSGIPARAQPWTEYEIAALPGLIRLYLTGEARISTVHDWKVQVMRGHPSAPAAAVSAPEDLIGRTLPTKRFARADGGEIDLDDSRGKQNVLVTILRGFGGHVCVYCTAQTKALAELADKFAALDTEVVVVFPGPASGLEAFLEAYRRTFGPGEKPLFPLLYDRDLTLTRALHIEGNIAVPTSILLDREGIIRWCRVAKDPADRPSAQEILERIAALPEHEH